MELYKVDESRIVFKNSRPYWNVFDEIDLLLDPFPAGSGTVGSDGLWMNRLSLAMRSRPIMGRIMSAQLSALGLDETYVVDSYDEYVKAAIRIAEDKDTRERLIQDSQGLRNKMINSDLMDYNGYGKKMGSLLRSLWIKYCDEQAPERG